MTSDKQSPVTSVDRALLILQIVGESGSGVTLDEIAARMGIPKSSVHRLLGALRHRGFVSQQELNGPYFLGTELLATAFRFYDRLDLRTLVHPLLQTLQSDLNETVHMAVLDGGEVVYMDKVEAIHSLRMSSVIGGRNPAHSTGVGKALLAWTYPTDDAARVWAAQYRPLVARTRHTLVSVPKLLENLAKIRKQGYALDLEENEKGVRCVAVPIFLGRPAPVAAVSVTAAKERMSLARADEIAVTVKRVISDEAGFART